MQEEKQKFLNKLADQYTEAQNQNAKDYLACIIGMWSHTYGAAIQKNPFEKDSNSGFWWHIGWRCSEKTFRSN